MISFTSIQLEEFSILHFLKGCFPTPKEYLGLLLNIPIRIGVNGGSLEKDIQEKYTEPTPEALFESAMRHVDILDRLNFNLFSSLKDTLSFKDCFMSFY